MSGKVVTGLMVAVVEYTLFGGDRMLCSRYLRWLSDGVDLR